MGLERRLGMSREPTEVGSLVGEDRVALGFVPYSTVNRREPCSLWEEVNSPNL